MKTTFDIIKEELARQANERDGTTRGLYWSVFEGNMSKLAFAIDKAYANRAEQIVSVIVNELHANNRDFRVVNETGGFKPQEEVLADAAAAVELLILEGDFP